MRAITKQGKTFSFSHFTYNRESQTTKGIREVHKAKLRKSARGDNLKHSNIKLFYLDMDTNLPRVCWQPLITYFNGKKVVLN